MRLLTTHELIDTLVENQEDIPEGFTPEQWLAMHGVADPEKFQEYMHDLARYQMVKFIITGMDEEDVYALCMAMLTMGVELAEAVHEVEAIH